MIEWRDGIPIRKGIRAVNRNQYLYRALLNIFRSITLLDYRLLNGYSFNPTNIVLEVTNRCNLRCKICWLWGESEVAKNFISRELSIKQIKKIIDEIALFRPLIHITGGEPFIRKDLLEIIKYIKSKRCIVGLTTNGTLISDDLAEKIIKLHVDVVTFSVDGPEEIHDKVRGFKVFEKIIENLATLVNRKKVLQSDLPIIRLRCVVSRENYEYLTEVVKLAENLGVDGLQFQHLFFTDEAHATDHAKLMKKLFSVDCRGIYGYITHCEKGILLETLTDEIKKIVNRKSPVNVNFFPSLKTSDEISKYYTDLSFTFRLSCVHPWFTAVIKPNGDLCLCPDSQIPEYTLGNLEDNSFIKLWNNKRARLFRSVLKRRGIFPGCLRCCGLFSKGSLENKPFR